MKHDINHPSPEALFEETQKALAMNVKNLRQAQGISQEELGLRMGADQSYISHVEGGKFNLTLLSLSEIAFALEVPVGKLLVPIRPEDRLSL